MYGRGVCDTRDTAPTAPAAAVRTPTATPNHASQAGSTRRARPLAAADSTKRPKKVVDATNVASMRSRTRAALPPGGDAVILHPEVGQLTGLHRDEDQAEAHRHRGPNSSDL